MRLRRPEGTATQRLVLRTRRDKLGGRKVIAEIEFNEEGVGECTKAVGQKLREAIPELELVGGKSKDTEEEEVDDG